MITVHAVQDPADLEAALAIREEVFVGEQGVTLEEEHDGLDDVASTTHVLALDDGTPVGTARLLSDDAHPGVVHVGRVAVRQRGRGLGVGRVLMVELERLALAQHGVPGADGVPQVRVELSAQESAIGFYERLGYEVAGERYLDARIWHRDASRTLRG